MDVELKTSAGALRGLQRDGHQAFLGIPYAAAPLGRLRFAAPEPPAAWSGVRGAQSFGAIAPQDQHVRFPTPGRTDEDCLTVNVFTPRADARRRPVLFFIHGGGFISGSGSQPTYDGGPLAALGDAVVVTFNYRLGALGFLYLDVRGPSNGVSSNAGVLDQVAALRWVRSNIAAFGGDPDQVTIFGESAGALSVCALLAMPAADRLFVRAIAQSGTANRLGNTDTATALTQRLFEKLELLPYLPARDGAFWDASGSSRPDETPGALLRDGVPAGLIERLRGLSVTRLLAATRSVATLGQLAPIIDGASLPERPLKAVREGRARSVPLLIGTNRDETKLYVDPRRGQLDDDALAQRVASILPHRARSQVGEVISTYRASRNARGLAHTNNDLLDAIETASRFGVPSQRLCEAQAAHQPRTYAYLFDWESPGRRHTMGACHALELPFVFGTVNLPGMKGWVGAGPAADRLSLQMMQAWLSFARSGDPSCEAAGDWPRYDSVQRQTKILGRHTRVEAGPFEEERALWDTLL